MEIPFGLNVLSINEYHQEGISLKANLIWSLNSGCFDHLKNITVTSIITCKFPASFIGYVGKSVYVGIWCLYVIITISSIDSLKAF